MTNGNQSHACHWSFVIVDGPCATWRLDTSVKTCCRTAGCSAAQPRIPRAWLTRWAVRCRCSPALRPDVDVRPALADIDVVRCPSDHTTTFENVYTDHGRHQTLHAVAERLTPDRFPAAHAGRYRASRADRAGSRSGLARSFSRRVDWCDAAGLAAPVGCAGPHQSDRVGRRPQRFCRAPTR